MTYNFTYLNQKIGIALQINATFVSFCMQKKKKKRYNQFARDDNFQYNILAGFYTLSTKRHNKREEKEKKVSQCYSMYKYRIYCKN